MGNFDFSGLPDVYWGLDYSHFKGVLSGEVLETYKWCC